MEAIYPYQIGIEQTEKDFDIKSLGFDTFDGDLTHACSGHSKVNAVTGEFYAFGYSMEEPVVHYTLFDKNRKVLNKMDIKITSTRMVHDTPICGDYIVIPD